MCFTKVTQSYFIVDNLQFKKILLHFRIIKGMPQRGQILSCKCTTSPVRDTSSNDTSSTTTLRRKFLSNYQFGEKRLRRMHFCRIRHLVEFLPWSKYLVNAMFCSILFCIYILSDLKVGSWSLE